MHIIGGAFSMAVQERTALDLQTVWINPNSMIVVRRRGGTLPVVLRRPVR